MRWNENQEATLGRPFQQPLNTQFLIKKYSAQSNFNSGKKYARLN